MWDEAPAVLASALMVLTGAPVALAGSSGQAEQAPGPGVEAGPFGPTGVGLPVDGPPSGMAQDGDLQDTLLVPTTTGTAEEPGRQAWFDATAVSPEGWTVTAGSTFNLHQPFVALFQPDGELAWAKEVDTGMDQGWPGGVAFGPDGSVYLAENSRNWSSTGVEAWNASLVKFDRQGEVLWERSFHQPNPMVWRAVSGVATGPTGEVAVTGGLSDRDVASGDYDSEVRVDTFDASGRHLWTASSSSISASWGIDLAFDRTGTLHVAGHGYDRVPGTHWTTWDNDPLYWRFDAEGHERMHLNIGDQGPRERFYAIDTTPTGSVHLGGFTMDEDWDYSTLRPRVAELGPLGQIDHVTEVEESHGYYLSVDAKASGALVAASPWPDPSHVDGLDDRGNLLWSEQDVLPGADGEGIDSAAVGPADRIHVAGTVTGSDTGQDAFVATLADAYSPAAQVERALAPGPLG